MFQRTLRFGASSCANSLMTAEQKADLEAEREDILVQQALILANTTELKARLTQIASQRPTPEEFAECQALTLERRENQKALAAIAARLREIKRLLPSVKGSFVLRFLRIARQELSPEMFAHIEKLASE